jgi:hypothetical protein
MTTPINATVETSGVVGNTGPVPVGNQATSGTTTDTTATAAGAFGSTTARPEPPTITVTPDTEGVYGPNKPENFTPVSVLLGGTRDTQQGFAGNL